MDCNVSHISQFYDILTRFAKKTAQNKRNDQYDLLISFVKGLSRFTDAETILSPAVTISPFFFTPLGFQFYHAFSDSQT